MNNIHLIVIAKPKDVQRYGSKKEFIVESFSIYGSGGDVKLKEMYGTYPIDDFNFFHNDRGIDVFLSTLFNEAVELPFDSTELICYTTRSTREAIRNVFEDGTVEYVISSLIYPDIIGVGDTPEEAVLELAGVEAIVQELNKLGE